MKMSPKTFFHSVKLHVKDNEIKTLIALKMSPVGGSETL